MTSRDSNQKLANALRDLAVFMEGLDGSLSDYAAVGYSHYVHDLAAARAIMDANPGGWRKDDSEMQSYTFYEKAFKDDDGKERAYFSIYVMKSATCERLQVGTRHIPATEARDEPVYEWRCGDDAGISSDKATEDLHDSRGASFDAASNYNH